MPLQKGSKLNLSAKERQRRSDQCRSQNDVMQNNKKLKNNDLIDRIVLIKFLESCGEPEGPETWKNIAMLHMFLPILQSLHDKKMTLNN